MNAWISSLLYTFDKDIIGLLCFTFLKAESKVPPTFCVGESGDAISKAARVLEQISGQEPVYGKGILFSKSF